MLGKKIDEFHVTWFHVITSFFLQGSIVLSKKLCHVKYKVKVNEIIIMKCNYILSHHSC
jgi:hypothetical protein